MNDALRKFDDDKDTGAIVLTGSGKAFAGTQIRMIVVILHSFADFTSRMKLAPILKR